MLGFNTTWLYFILFFDPLITTCLKGPFFGSKCYLENQKDKKRQFHVKK